MSFVIFGTESPNNDVANLINTHLLPVTSKIIIKVFMCVLAFNIDDYSSKQWNLTIHTQFLFSNFGDRKSQQWCWEFTQATHSYFQLLKN